ncbi:hypothetical protein EBZ38_01665 [bacterium]|nr:hypothetical protein [bacterium]
MTNKIKWDEARTQELTTFVGAESPVSVATVNAAADQLGTTARSIATKLRKLDYEVERVSTVASKTFNSAQEDALRVFLEGNSGEYTFAEIAGVFADGEFSPKQIQGKILSMEMTNHVKPAERKAYERRYTEADQARFVKMASEGSMLEDIASALGRTVASIRGKALSLLRSGEISAIPPSQKIAKVEDPFQGLEVAALTVDELSEKLGRSPRGIKTMLTRRGIAAADYDGAAKREKAAARADA